MGTSPQAVESHMAVWLECWNDGLLEKGVLASGTWNLKLGEDTEVRVNGNIRLDDKMKIDKFL